MKMSGMAVFLCTTINLLKISSFHSSLNLSCYLPYLTWPLRDNLCKVVNNLLVTAIDYQLLRTTMTHDLYIVSFSNKQNKQFKMF